MAQGRKAYSEEDIQKANALDMFLQRSLEAYKADDSETEAVIARYRTVTGKEPTGKVLADLELIHAGRCDAAIAELQRRINNRGLVKATSARDMFGDDFLASLAK